MYRKFDGKLGCEVVTIFAGEYYISKEGELLSTVLGSCISVCLYDPGQGIGGMNHFMLPEGGDIRFSEKGLLTEQLTETPLRYGITSMEVLIAEMQKRGARRSALRAKIFGGGNVLSFRGERQTVGEKNIGFVRAFLKSEEIPLEGEDVGGSHGRKVYFFSGKNAVFVRRVAMEKARREEQVYSESLKQKEAKKSDVTLF